jgi:hypothetical protein
MPLNLKGKKLAVVGGRNFDDKERLYKILTKNYDRIKMIISGGANGADTLAVEWAKDYGVPYLVFPAAWKNPFTGEHDKGAGFRRNRYIVEHCDVVIAFWDGESTGTKHTIDMATELKKPLKVYRFDSAPAFDPLTEEKTVETPVAKTPEPVAPVPAKKKEPTKKAEKTKNEAVMDLANGLSKEEKIALMQELAQMQHTPAVTATVTYPIARTPVDQTSDDNEVL